MDGNAGSFEDQFRRMLVSNETSPGSNDAAPPAHPTVRLPPASSYPVSQQPRPSQGFPPQHQNKNGFMTSPPPFAQPPRGQQSHFRGGPNAQPYQAQRGGHFGHQQGFYQNRGGFNAQPNPRINHGSAPGQRSRNQQQLPLDPNAFQRTSYGPPRGRGGQQHHLFNPHQQRAPGMTSFNDQQQRKVNYLQAIATSEVSNVQMSEAERDEKNAFRQALQQVCNEVCDADPTRLPQVSLECFGSLKSGFATAGSDMDLVIVVKDQNSTSASLSLLEDDLPRALERMLLKLGYGARLLTRTRVPIIKVCEKPDSSLLSKLRAEREKWDLLPNELKYPHLHQDGGDDVGEGAVDAVEAVDAQPKDTTATAGRDSEAAAKASNQAQADADVSTKATDVVGSAATPGPETQTQAAPNTEPAPDGGNMKADNARPKREDRPWIRERKAGPLDFPKSGVGIQTDINFFNPLGLHNTHLLHCYSLCDDRVQPMVLFVKAWAKRRKINSSYSGTLSSYGYVLMVLHYLVHVASPPVLPNLQDERRPFGPFTMLDRGVEIDGWTVRFWGSVEDILAAKQRGHLTANREPLGSLLAGFFQYFSSQGGLPQFVWTQEVLSLRTPGGIFSKEDKGWTRAVTEEGEGKKIQHRYLFCIEDPFELNHNVARTVTHNGIVAIRDEFRRARRILMVVGRGDVPVIDGQLFDELVEPELVASIAHEPKAEGWQPDTDGASDKHPPQIQAKVTQPQIQQRNGSRKKAPQTPSASNSTTAPNVKDDAAFPSLGAGSASKKKLRSPHKEKEGEWSEISGDKAKAVLDEVKRKRDEAQAESTALGAAEAVLGDEW